jgi:hypothetical protein
MKWLLTSSFSNSVYIVEKPVELEGGEVRGEGQTTLLLQAEPVCPARWQPAQHSQIQQATYKRHEKLFAHLLFRKSLNPLNLLKKQQQIQNYDLLFMQ